MVKNEPELQEIDAGDEIYSWKAWEFEPHERSRMWYIFASLISVACIIYAVWTENYLFAIIILMIGIIFLVNNLRKPKIIDVHITNMGIVVGEEFHDYKEIKDFSLIYAPPEIKILYIDFHKVWMPLLTLPLEDADPNIVRESLLPYAFENLDREEESLTDMLKRVYKL